MRLVGLVALGLVGCAPHVRPVPAAVAAPVATGMAVVLASDRTADDLVHVTETWSGTAPSGLSFSPLGEARISEVSARDDGGGLPLRVEGARFELSRPARGSLVLSYGVTLGRKPGASSAEPVEVHVQGADVLLLGEGEERMPVSLSLRVGVSASGGASSFGLGADQSFMATYGELRRAWFLAGDVGHASYHAADGDDVAAWIGHTAFDPRWVSAETAAVRGAIDTWVGASRAADAPPTSLLFVATKRDAPPVTVGFATRGLVVSADRRAPWNAATRILVAQAMTRRYIGGLLAIGDGERFWSDGFSRAIAGQVVFEAGTIDHGDRAAELNGLLAAIAFAEEPDALATARGALAATALDVALHRKQSDLRGFVRGLLSNASSAQRTSLPHADFLRAVAATPAGEPAAQALDATVVRGAESELPVDTLGRCYRLEKRQLVPFELGFTTSADQELAILSVKAGSRAARSGLAVGDAVRDLQYTPGRSDVPVTLTLVRGGKARAVKFLPAGPARPGRVFERVPGIKDEAC